MDTTFVAVAPDVDAAPGAALPVGHSVAIRWNNAALAALRVEKPGPPMAARSLAIVHTAMYDAWAAYSPQAVGTRLGDTLRRPPTEHTLQRREEAVSYAAYRGLIDQFPARQADFGVVMTDLGYDPAVTSTDPATAAGVGNAAAAAVLTYRHADGSNQLGTMTVSGLPYADYTGYVPANPPTRMDTPTPLSDTPAPQRWQPLTYTDDTGVDRTPGFIGPHWGRVLPFALSTGDQFRPPPPQQLWSQGFLDQARHVIRTQRELTDEQKVIAEYWADGPNSELPPGHWCLFAQDVSARDGHGLRDDVLMFFALTNAIFDASIATWEAKRHYDYVRPITAIRYLFAGRTVRAWGGPAVGIVDLPGNQWRTFQVVTFPTPPFPEYASGHSGFSTAGATVLRAFTGSDTFGSTYTQPAHSLEAEPDAPAMPVTLTWPTFTEAALQAGESRIYGGIHFYEGNVAGLELGRRVGQLAWQRARGYWMGTA